MTTADVVRNFIEQASRRWLPNGQDLRDTDDARLTILWEQIEAHLRAADLCELQEDWAGVTRHLEGVIQQLNQVLAVLDA